ncbi:MAG: glycoside hydrolase 100 family protein [bacterium]|nr:glycoside hydrolase 100 family protein [bacterium]
MSSQPITLENHLIIEAKRQALDVLRRCVHTLGVQASASSALYKKVWARDSMITLLGAVPFADAKLRRAFRQSLRTLARFQTPLGQIPNYVDTVTGKATFRAYADGGLWFVIGASAYGQHTKDWAFVRQLFPNIQRVLAWYATQSPDRSGFVTMDEAADWEDIFGVHGKGLTVNVLYAHALRTAGSLAKKFNKPAMAKTWTAQARQLQAMIRDRFWYTPKRDIFAIVQDSFGMKTRLRRQQLAKHGRKAFIEDQKFMSRNSFFLPYITFLNFGEWFDSLGNLLAILTGIATPSQARTILRFIQQHKLHRPWAVRATWPVRTPGKKDWQHYYILNNLNLPDQYHNGGAWPYLGGLYVVALAKVGWKKEAQQELVRLAKMAKQGMHNEWEFNEWFHGRTGKPMGKASQAWSAGMYLLAYRLVHRKLSD